MAKTVADVMTMVKDNEVKFVDFRFTKLTWSRLKILSLPIDISCTASSL